MGGDETTEVSSIHQRNMKTYAERRILWLERLLERLEMVIRQIVDDDRNRVQNHHQPGHRELHIGANSLVEARERNIGGTLRDAQLVYKGQNSAWRNAAAAKGNQSEQLGRVPAADIAVVNELVQLSLRQDSSGQIEAAVFSLHGLKDVQLVDQPVVRLPRQLEFGRAKTMGDILKGIDQAMGKVVGWVHRPFRAGAEMMIVLNDSVGSDIPHLRIRVLQVLFHAQRCLFCLVFTITHGTKLGERFLNWTATMGASIAFTTFALAASSLSFDFGLFNQLAPVSLDVLCLLT